MKSGLLSVLGLVLIMGLPSLVNAEDIAIPGAPSETPDVSSQVEPAQKAEVSHRFGQSHMTTTLRNVHVYLMSRGQLPKDSQLGACASGAVHSLPQYGYVKTKSTPATAKVGEVCVLDGGPKVCDGKPVGTIAVRTQDGWYDGATNPKIFAFPHRNPIGCFAKTK